MFRLSDPWPRNGERMGTFESKRVGRSLVILLDRPEGLDAERLEYLRSFESHDSIEIVTTTESTRRVTAGNPDELSGIRSVRLTYPTGFRDTAILDWAYVKQLIAEDVAEYAIGDASRARSIHEAHLLAAMASAIGANVTVSGNRDIERLRIFEHRSANVLSLDDAIHLLGLFLRSRGDNAIQVGPNFQHLMDLDEQTLRLIWTSFTNVRDLFWRIREIGTDEANEEVAVAMVRRMQQLVIVADRCMQRGLQPGESNIGTDTRIDFDSGTVFATGALDAMARLIDEVLEIGTKKRRIGMTNKDWHKAVSDSSPAIGQFLEASKLTFNLIYKFRNHIHGETYADIEVRETGDTRRRLHRIPTHSSDDIFRLHEILQLSDRWGIEKFADGSCWISVPEVLHWMRDECLTWNHILAGELLVILGQPHSQKPEMFEFLPDSGRWCSRLFGIKGMS